MHKKSLLAKRIANVSLTGIAVLIAVLCSPALSQQNRVNSREPEQATSLKRARLQNVEQLLSQVESAELNQKYGESEQIWRKIIQLQPDAIWASYGLAKVLSTQGKFDEAILIYREIIQRHPEEAEAYYSLGRVLLNRTHFSRIPASIALTKYDRQAPILAERRAREVQAQYDLGEVILAYRRGIELQPDRIESLDWSSVLSPEEIVSVVRQELQSKSTKTAIDYLLLWSALQNLRVSLEAPAVSRRNLPAACQKFPDGCRDRGRSDLKQESNALQQAIQFDPQLATPYEMLGVYYYDQRDYAQAVTAFKQAIKLSPQNVKVYYRLGDVHIAQNELDKAIQALYQAVQVEPHKTSFDFRFWFPSLWVSTRQDRSKIIAALANKLNQCPGATGHYILGNLFANLNYPNQLDLAVVAYQNAVKLDPTFAKAYERLGFVLATQKKLKEAEVAFRRAIQLEPALNSAYRNLRDILRTQGKFDDAFQVFLAEQTAPKQAQPNKPTAPEQRCFVSRKAYHAR